MTDSQILSAVRDFWKLSRGFYPSLPLQRMLDGYRAQKTSGKSDNDIVIYWSSKEVGMSRADAGTFVTAMKKISAGETIQNPNERPSWKEVVDESGLPGTKKFEFPWVKATAIGAVALFVVWGLPNLVKATRDSGHRQPKVV
jgi:hypothetical protein